VTYLLNADYRQLVHVEIRDFASQYLAGNAGVIETSRRLSPYAHVVEGVDLSVHETLRTFVAIDSETDDLPIGAVREMWHPSTATLQDQSILHAERIYRDVARSACAKLIALMDERSPMIEAD
jgi:hypothetical protein